MAQDHARILGFLQQSLRLLSPDASTIPLLILLTVASQDENDGISVKELVNSLPFSEMGVRYHLNRLVKKKLLIIKIDVNDRRRRILQPARKLIERLALIRI